MRSIVVAALLAASVVADAAPCARPAALPADLPLMDCPQVECLKGCDRRGQIVARLTYDAPSGVSPADASRTLAARWKEALEKANWKIIEKGGELHGKRGHDKLTSVVTTRGKVTTVTVAIDPA